MPILFPPLLWDGEHAERTTPRDHLRFAVTVPCVVTRQHLHAWMNPVQVFKCRLLDGGDKPDCHNSILLRRESKRRCQGLHRHQAFPQKPKFHSSPDNGCTV